MAGVTKLEIVDPRKDVCDDVVQLLKSVLDKARRGEVLGVAIAFVCDDAKTATAFSQTCKFSYLHSAVCTLAARMSVEGGT